MDLNKDIKLFNNSKNSKLPNKKSMNLYQPDYKNDPKTIAIVATLVVLLITAVLGKFLILDKVLELNAYKAETDQLEASCQEMFTRYSTYNELKEKYYRYSENYSKDEQALIDRITVTSMLSETTKDLASITSTNISGNSVSIRVITSDLDKLKEFRVKLESVPFVKNVVVYSAQRDTGDVTSSVAFQCIVEEAN